MNGIFLRWELTADGSLIMLSETGDTAVKG